MYAVILKLTLGSRLISFTSQQYDIILLGGLSGRLDQTIHTLSYLHKLRKTRKRAFVVTDECIGWVLDEVSIIFILYRNSRDQQLPRVNISSM